MKYTLPCPLKISGGREMIALLSSVENSVSFTEKVTASLLLADTF